VQRDLQVLQLQLQDSRISFRRRDVLNYYQTGRNNYTESVLIVAVAHINDMKS